MTLLCLIRECPFGELLAGFWIVQVFVSLFLSILFLQSGLDKVFDWNGNLGWLKEHFSKTLLKNKVPLMLAVVAIVELSAGIFSALGVLEAAVFKTYCSSLAGTLLAGLALILLFFGQRVARDYAGAAVLVGYFILVVIDLYFLLA